MQIENNLVQYNEALELKQLGFNEKCIAEYFGKTLTFYRNLSETVQVTIEGRLEWVKENTILSQYKNSSPNHFDKQFTVCVPTYSQAFAWFREKHQLFHEIGVDQTTYPKFAFDITEFIGNPKDLTEREWDWKPVPADPDWSLYRTYPEAELACLQKLIKLIKK